MDSRVYFIVDGSRLLSVIHEIQRTRSEFKEKKLDVGLLASNLRNLWSRYYQAHVRTIFYFKKNDDRIKKLLTIPKATEPGKKDHWLIVHCGENLKSIPDEELAKLDKKYRNIFPRTEKGLDIRLTCDALLLVSTGKASDLVLLVNDSDYIPLFETIQRLGANVYLTSLDKEININKKLADLADVYLTLDNLSAVFV